MNNELELKVKFTFTEDANVTEKDKEAIIDNLLDAIKRQINNGMGIAPEEPEQNDYITEVVAITDEKGLGLVFDLSNNQFI
jgi:hypothetical protein